MCVLNLHAGNAIEENLVWVLSPHAGIIIEEAKFIMCFANDIFI